MYKISFRNGENYCGFDIRVDRIETAGNIVMEILDGANDADNVKVTIERGEVEIDELVSD